MIPSIHERGAKVTASEYLDARERAGPPVSWLEAEQWGLVHYNAETRLVEIAASRADIAETVRRTEGG